MHAVPGMGSPTYVPTAAPNPASKQDLQTPTRVRTAFPETWLWSSTTVGY